MEWLIWIGAAMTALGLVGVIASGVMVARARRAATDDADLRARLTKILPVNIGGLFGAMLGLMVLITGLLLG